MTDSAVKDATRAAHVQPHDFPPPGFVRQVTSVSISGCRLMCLRLRHTIVVTWRTKPGGWKSWGSTWATRVAS